jgi:hypothetical protein
MTVSDSSGDSRSPQLVERASTGGVKKGKGSEQSIVHAEQQP